MIHLGDITQIYGHNIPPVDVITFGSPCQDLSVAGKRAGLGGGTERPVFRSNQDYTRNEGCHKWKTPSFRCLGKRARGI